MGGACIYGGTKAFLDRVCTGAAMELYEDGIAVNSLAPTGAIATPLSISVGVPPEGTEPMETVRRGLRWRSARATRPCSPAASRTACPCSTS